MSAYNSTGSTGTLWSEMMTLLSFCTDGNAKYSTGGYLELANQD